MSDNYQFNLDDLVKEFVQLVNEESSDMSTDPNIKRVKIIKTDCGCASNDCENFTIED